MNWLDIGTEAYAWDVGPVSRRPCIEKVKVTGGLVRRQLPFGFAPGGTSCFGKFDAFILAIDWKVIILQKNDLDSIVIFFGLYVLEDQEENGADRCISAQCQLTIKVSPRLGVVGPLVTAKAFNGSGCILLKQERAGATGLSGRAATGRPERPRARAP